jgi:phosphate-selective porin OprO and OprP
MHLRIHRWLALSLAMVAIGGTTVAARGQENQISPAYTNVGSSTVSDVNRTPPTTPTSQNYLVSENLNADDANVAARLADIEKALKKIDDKTKADKEKAASGMTFTPAGRVQVDTASFTREGNYLGGVPEANGIEFRRLYFGGKGTGFDVIEYKVEFDFAGTMTNNKANNAYSTTSVPGKIAAKDVYVQVNELPMIGHVRIGNFYEPLGFETVTSDLYVTFMERANTSMITPDRHIGIMAFDHPFENENATWWLGAFCSAGGDGGMLFQETNSQTAAAATGRATWLPWYDEATNGRGLLHVGVAGSYRNAWGDQYPLTSPSLRPEESHLAATYNATMNNIDYVKELGAEMAFVYGPFSVQSEFVGAYAVDFAGDTHPINSCYVYTSYFLTGENRVYDRNSATFTRIRPFENFFRVRDENGDVCTGKGAWEVGYRWSYIDFRDAVSNTGKADRFSNHTLGLSWYLNPFTKMMFNYVYSTDDPRTGATGYLSTYEMRAQVDF